DEYFKNTLEIDNPPGYPQGDIELLIDQLKRSALKYLPEAIVNYTDISDDEVLYTDYDEAFRLLEMASVLGSADAFFNMGVLYHAFIKDGEKSRESIKYYEKAIELGDTRSFVNLAKLYLVLKESDNLNYTWDRYFTIFNMNNPNIEDLMTYVLHCVEGSTSEKHIAKLKPFKTTLLNYNSDTITFEPNEIESIKKYIKKNLSWYSR